MGALWKRAVAFVVGGSALRKAAIIGTVAGAAIVAMFARCRPQTTPLPLHEATDLAVHDQTKPAFDSAQQKVQQQTATVITKLVTDSTALRAAHLQIAQLRKTADSALAIARAHDTTAAASSPAELAIDRDAFKVAADARTDEAKALQTAVDSQAKDLTLSHATIDAQAGQLLAASARQRASDDLTARLAADVKRASECRWFFNQFTCQSRWAAFGEGAALATASALTIKYHAQLGIK